jgi:hypothetical protein
MFGPWRAGQIGRESGFSKTDTASAVLAIPIPATVFLGRPFLVLKDTIPWVHTITRRTVRFAGFADRLDRGDPSIDTVLDAHIDTVLRRRLKNIIRRRMTRTRHRAPKRRRARPRPVLGGTIGRGRLSHARQTGYGVTRQGTSCPYSQKVIGAASHGAKMGVSLPIFAPKGLHRFRSRPFFIPLPPQASKCSGNRFRANGILSSFIVASTNLTVGPPGLPSAFRERLAGERKCRS